MNESLYVKLFSTNTSATVDILLELVILDLVLPFMNQLSRASRLARGSRGLVVGPSKRAYRVFGN